MSNQEFIQKFIKGGQKYGAYCHLAIVEDRLINYSTEICVIDRENKTAKVNVKKYSNTTSRIQSTLRWELKKAGYEITDYVGEEAYWWNYGYQGAGNWTTSEVKERYANG